MFYNLFYTRQTMRFHLQVPEQIQIRESQGFVKDIYDPTSSVRTPLSEYKTFLDLIHRDGTLATCYDIITEFTTYRGFDFIRGDKSKRDKLRNLFENDLNFKQVLPNIIYSLLYYGDCFLELRKNNSKTTNELWVLETTEMRIEHDKNGKVSHYIQRPFNMSGMTDEEAKTAEKEQGVFWTPDEVIHFRMKWIGSQVYSYNPNEPISQVASTKLYAGNYLMNIFINMPPRYVAHLAGVSLTDYNNAKRDFQAAKTNYKKTIAFTRSSDPNSKLTINKIEPPYDQTLLDIMKYLNNELLKITRVPRTWVEGSQAENRGVGESLNLPFEVHIRYIHSNILEPPINRKLMKELGEEVKDIKSPQLRFNEISRKAELEIIQNAGYLRNAGMKSEAYVRYLDERGILGFEPDDFEEMQQQDDMDLSPSRKRMDKGVDSMTQNRDEAGVSDSKDVKRKKAVA